VDSSGLIADVNAPGNRQATGIDNLKIGSGQMVAIYMWVTLDSPAKVPAAITHKISAKFDIYPEELTVQTARLPVSRDIALISAPLRGDNWQAGNGPSITSGHRRSLLPIDGHAQIAQRFGIDWVRLNRDGRTFTGDPKDNKNYRAYGTQVLAVADGVVTETKDGIPQNVPGLESRAVPITLETVAGNHIILDLGHGRYALYAHLQPGSLKVKLGDHVKTRTGACTGGQFRELNRAPSAFPIDKRKLPAGLRRHSVRAGVIRCETGAGMRLLANITWKSQWKMRL
jgi:murein DD-endopeptidase MepM/ murein hydrolase activator NlpD